MHTNCHVQGCAVLYGQPKTLSRRTAYSLHCNTSLNITTVTQTNTVPACKRFSPNSITHMRNLETPKLIRYRYKRSRQQY